MFVVLILLIIISMSSRFALGFLLMGLADASCFLFSFVQRIYEKYWHVCSGDRGRSKAWFLPRVTVRKEAQC